MREREREREKKKNVGKYTDERASQTHCSIHKLMIKNKSNK